MVYLPSSTWQKGELRQTLKEPLEPQKLRRHTGWVPLPASGTPTAPVNAGEVTCGPCAVAMPAALASSSEVKELRMMTVEGEAVEAGACLRSVFGLLVEAAKPRRTKGNQARAVEYLR